MIDWSNKEVLNNPNLSYTSRDYTSIYNDLINAIPNLTKIYKPTEETDPGIVLIKMISMLGDMLSHTSDLNALEVYPRTVLQLPNAKQIFRLVGYKMKWYQSARCAAYFTNANSVPVTIHRFNVFTAGDSAIKYTNLNQIDIPAGASGSTQYRAELIQGTPVTPTLSTIIDNSYYTGSWYDQYDFNVDAKRVVGNNRIYLDGTTVDGSTIMLIDDDNTSFAVNEWTLVDNLNTLTDIGKYFEFDFDETGSPYIELVNYWNSMYSITRFKLFYVVSDGSAGEITDNALTQISPNNVTISGTSDKTSYLKNVHIYNSASTYGSRPETPEQARKNAELYINTIQTLVVLDDFRKAAKRIQGVANAIATDLQTDPDREHMLPDTVKLYMIRLPGYSNDITEPIADMYGSSDFNDLTPVDQLDEMWKESVRNELNSYKLGRYDIDVVFENSIDWIDWTIEGSIWLRQPIPVDKNHDLMVRINQSLDHTFSPVTLDFAEPINYIDVIDNIKSVDKLIYHVDLATANIQYSRILRDTNGNPTGLTVDRRWLIYSENTGAYTFYWANGFGCLPTPGGDGTGSNEGYRIFRDDGATWSTGLNLDTGSEINEFEIYNDRIYSWVQEERIPTDYYIKHSNEDPYLDRPIIMKNNGEGPDTETEYYFVEKIVILLEDGKESGEYLVRNVRDINGKSENESGFSSSSGRDVYDIWNEKYNEWTRRFIDRNTGEIFIVRGGAVYSTKRYYNEDTGEIVDGFGDILYDEEGNYRRKPVTKEALTGRYEQTIPIQNERTYNFYLGQTLDGIPLVDANGDVIEGFPIKPDGFHIFVNTDEYVIHDNGSGTLVGTPGILSGYGSIDYATGEVNFTIAEGVELSSLKIVYYKNVITMARYTYFDPEKFYTQPQFLKYSNANRMLG